MLEGTVKALVSLDHPHDTWVLDEGDDEKVAALYLKIGARHFSRKTFPGYLSIGEVVQPGTKHGNYNVWFYESGCDNYEIITIFDPDHIPQSSFLSLSERGVFLGIYAALI